MPVSQDDLTLIATTIRTLSMDAIQKANSGHPGMPMGCADIAAVLWSSILSHNPDDPGWINRDRFVLSAGHGSMLLYSMLHLSGYSLSLDDIKNFRQFRSRTPGHPEHYVTEGVETTTGPLGQGFANGIGMAIAQKMLQGTLNNADTSLIDHYIYGLVSDGDIMEGISSEAASLAGHLGLGNIIYIYDYNEISIEGCTDLTFSEDVAKRFEAYGWDVQTINGHDYKEISDSVNRARAETARPSIIIAKTIIAKGSACMEGSEASHGAPLGDEEVRASKINLMCDEDSTFCVPERVYEIFNKRKEELLDTYNEWQEKYRQTVTGELKDSMDRLFSIPSADELRPMLPVFTENEKIATRSAGGRVLESLYDLVPGLMGGSADLGPSNKTFVKGHTESGKNRLGRNMHFGIREHAMGAIQNGIAYYGGFIPFSATFFIFMDYMRPAVRMAALGGLHAIYVFTHDSFFVGEDGPTHQPVEQLAAARAIPNLHVLRPADAEETREAWLYALERNDGPTALVLTRQNIPVLSRGNGNGPENLKRGAYVIRDCNGTPDVIILASGSEVHISVEAAEMLESDNIQARVVSFPSWELFDAQDNEYRKKVIEHGIPKVVVEAGIRMGWDRYVQAHGLYITREDFGESAPASELAEEFGFTKEAVAESIRNYLREKPGK